MLYAPKNLVPSQTPIYQDQKEVDFSFMIDGTDIVPYAGVKLTYQKLIETKNFTLRNKIIDDDSIAEDAQVTVESKYTIKSSEKNTDLLPKTVDCEFTVEGSVIKENLKTEYKDKTYQDITNTSGEKSIQFPFVERQTKKLTFFSPTKVYPVDAYKVGNEDDFIEYDNQLTWGVGTYRYPHIETYPTHFYKRSYRFGEHNGLIYCKGGASALSSKININVLNKKIMIVPEQKEFDCEYRFDCPHLFDPNEQGDLEQNNYIQCLTLFNVFSKDNISGPLNQENTINLKKYLFDDGKYRNFKIKTNFTYTMPNFTIHNGLSSAGSLKHSLEVTNNSNDENSVGGISTQYSGTITTYNINETSVTCEIVFVPDDNNIFCNQQNLSLKYTEGSKGSTKIERYEFGSIPKIIMKLTGILDGDTIKFSDMTCSIPDGAIRLYVWDTDCVLHHIAPQYIGMLTTGRYPRIEFSKNIVQYQFTDLAFIHQTVDSDTDLVKYTEEIHYLPLIPVNTYPKNSKGEYNLINLTYDLTSPEIATIFNNIAQEEFTYTIVISDTAENNQHLYLSESREEKCFYVHENKPHVEISQSNTGEGLQYAEGGYFTGKFINNIGNKPFYSFQWKVYDINGAKLLYSADPVQSADFTFEYNNFVPGQQYTIYAAVVDLYGETYEGVMKTKWENIPNQLTFNNKTIIDYENTGIKVKWGLPEYAELSEDSINFDIGEEPQDENQNEQSYIQNSILYFNNDKRNKHIIIPKSVIMGRYISALINGVVGYDNNIITFNYNNEQQITLSVGRTNDALQYNDFGFWINNSINDQPRIIQTLSEDELIRAYLFIEFDLFENTYYVTFFDGETQQSWIINNGVRSQGGYGTYPHVDAILDSISFSNISSVDFIACANQSFKENIQFRPLWDPNQYLFLLNFENPNNALAYKDPFAKEFASGEAQMQGYKVFKENIMTNSRINMGQYYFPADIKNIENYCSFIDYSVPHNTEVRYILYPIVNNKLLMPAYFDSVKPIWDKWCLFTTKGPAQKQIDSIDTLNYNENVLTVDKIFLFEMNVETGSITNNTDFSIVKNFTPYPFIQRSPSNYWSGQLKGLLGRIAIDGVTFKQTPDMLQEIKELTQNTSRKFLKDRDGNFWEVEISSAVTIDNNDKLDVQLKTKSFNWVEIGDASNISLLSLGSEKKADWLLTELGYQYIDISQHLWDDKAIWDDQKFWTEGD